MTAFFKIFMGKNMKDKKIKD